MSYDLLSSGSSVSALRAGCDPFDVPNLPSNSVAGINNNYNNSSFSNNNSNGGNFPFKPLAMSYTPTPRPHLTMAEQAELEFELRYRGNMIVDQQRKIQQLEDDLKRTRDQMDMMNNQIAAYEQERMKERKKPQSRYWTPEEHSRFLEALNKYGHKDVKAISNHVSTRNATQVRTHAQKYFLRLERERRKKGEYGEVGLGRDDGGYGSSGDEFSDNSMSPMMEELSPTQQGSSSGVATPPITPSSLLNQPRRRRAVSLITPTLGRYASSHRDAVLAELPSWTPEDYDQFVKGLLSLVDKQEDIGQVIKTIREGYVPHLSEDDIETCYKIVHKILKQRPVQPPISSPKRRRTSKPELPLNISVLEAPLPAMGTMTLGGGNSPFTPFMGGMPTVQSSLPHPQFSSNMNNGANSPVLQPFPPSMSGLMSMGMGMRPLMEYGNNMSTMAPLQMNNTNNMGLNSMMGMMDISSVAPSSSQSQGWNSLSYSFDLHSNSSPSLSLPQGAPLVSSLN